MMVPLPFKDLQERAKQIRPRYRLTGDGSHVNCVAFSRDSRLLAVGSKTISFFDAETGRESPITIPAGSREDAQREVLYTFHPESVPVHGLAFSPDGKYLAFCRAEGILWLWEVGSKNIPMLRHVHPGTFNSLAFSSDGKTLTIGSGSSLDLLSLEGEAILFLRAISTGLGINSVDFSPDGRLLASGSDSRVVQVWEVMTGNLVFELKNHTASVTGVRFSPDGKLLASSSGDGTVRICDVERESQLEVLHAASGSVRAIAWSQDGNLLISRTRNSAQGIRFWHTGSWRLVHAIPQFTTQNDDIWRTHALAISPNGKLLAAYPPDSINELELLDISAFASAEDAAQESVPLQRVRPAAENRTSVNLHLLTLPLAHTTPPTPPRPAAWLRSACAVGASLPLFLAQDLGTLLTQPRAQLSLARPGYLPADLDTSTYLTFLTRLSTHRLLREVSGWDISDAMTGVVLAKLMADVIFPQEYAITGGVDIASFARRLGVELDNADAEQLWQQTDPALRPRLNELLSAQEMAQIEANLRRLDADELRFLHHYGPRFAGTPDPQELLDLFSLLDVPPAVELVLNQMLRLIPRISQSVRTGGMQTYAMGGYAGLTHKGNLDSLIPTELAYPPDMFLYRLLNQEALYFGRETERERQRELAYIVTQAGLDVRGDADVLARALTLALAQTMQRRGYDVQQSFVGSLWTEPNKMTRPGDVQRVLYHRDEGWLRSKEMLEAVLAQLRAWTERYRGMHVMWVVSEYWDADDSDANKELYAALRQSAEQQSWFIRLGKNGAPGSSAYPAAARYFVRHQFVSNELLWSEIKPPERIYVSSDTSEVQSIKRNISVRYDGVYVSEYAPRRWEVLRFYDDGTVLSVNYAGTPDLEQAALWLHRTFPLAWTGHYTIEGSNIRFHITGSQKVVTVVGEQRIIRANPRTVDYSGGILRDAANLKLDAIEHYGDSSIATGTVAQDTLTDYSLQRDYRFIAVSKYSEE